MNCDNVPSIAGKLHCLPRAIAKNAHTHTTFHAVRQRSATVLVHCLFSTTGTVGRDGTLCPPPPTTTYPRACWSRPHAAGLLYPVPWYNVVYACLLLPSLYPFILLGTISYWRWHRARYAYACPYTTNAQRSCLHYAPRCVRRCCVPAGARACGSACIYIYLLST